MTILIKGNCGFGDKYTSLLKKYTKLENEKNSFKNQYEKPYKI